MSDQLAMMDAANHYWNIVKEIPSDDLLSYRPRALTPVSYGRTYDSKTRTFSEREWPSRDELVKLYSWSIPSPVVLRFILSHLDGRAIVEMGAGTGYWASLLSLGGARVDAFDQAPPDQGGNWYHSEHEEYYDFITQADVDEHNRRLQPLIDSAAQLAKLTAETDNPFPIMAPPEPPCVGDQVRRLRPVETDHREIFFPVAKGSVEVLDRFPDHVLMISWPPHDSPFARDALAAYRGDTFIYIGEGIGGCTADDDFFALLEDEWEEVAGLFAEFVSWSGINDAITIYRRKS